MISVEPEDLLYGYVHGIFPMAETDGTIYWYAPDPRAVIPLESYRPARSLRPVLNKGVFEIRVDSAFEEVIRHCAAPRKYEKVTWISEGIIQAYTELHHNGFAHSVEAYREGRLVGGLYGVSIGAAFFGESMFHVESNASKVAFHYLIGILRSGGFRLLDTQFINDNVKRFGAVEISKGQYLHLLRLACKETATFAWKGSGA